jgi:hypothetical protein
MPLLKESDSQRLKIVQGCHLSMQYAWKFQGGGRLRLLVSYYKAIINVKGTTN